MTTTPATRGRRAAATAALAAALLTVPAAGARAAGGPDADADPSADRLLLTVSGAQDTWIRGVVLTCPPAAGAPHPRAVEACAELSSAGGDLDALPVEFRPCPLVLDPVTATADGAFDGRAVSWRRTYPNSCFMDATTGPLFRF